MSGKPGRSGAGQGLGHIPPAGRLHVQCRRGGRSSFADVPYKLITPYCVSKAGVRMLARSMAI